MCKYHQLCAWACVDETVLLLMAALLTLPSPLAPHPCSPARPSTTAGPARQSVWSSEPSACSSKAGPIARLRMRATPSTETPATPRSFDALSSTLLFPFTLLTPCPAHTPNRPWPLLASASCSLTTSTPPSSTSPRCRTDLLPCPSLGPHLTSLPLTHSHLPSAATSRTRDLRTTWHVICSATSAAVLRAAVRARSERRTPIRGQRHGASRSSAVFPTVGQLGAFFYACPPLPTCIFHSTL